MRVVTYNVQSCRAGVTRVADLIRSADPDAAVLNEVRYGHARSIARSLGMHVAFGVTLRWRRFGNAIISRERPAASRSRRFSVDPPAEGRGMIAVTLPSGLVVAGVPLGLSSA